jgi:hypothetical protein
MVRPPRAVVEPPTAMGPDGCGGAVRPPGVVVRPPAPWRSKNFGGVPGHR